MKKRKFIAIMLVAASLLSGCTVASRHVFFSFMGPYTVFSMGSLSCGRTEAEVYLANYKNLYGKVGKTDLWDGAFDTEEVEEGLKTAAINHLSKVYSLDLYAKENDITLDDEEKTKVAAAAKEYSDSLSEEDKKATGADLGKIRKMYEHYALAEKVYSMLMDSVDEEVSEDEARIMDAYILYVTDKKTYRKLAKQIRNGATFERLLSTYSEGDKGEVSFGRGTYPGAVEEVAFALEDGEVSDGIKADDGYYFVQCIDKYNEELSEENKKKIVAGRKADLVETIVSDQHDRYDSQINTKLLERMHIDVGDEVRTDSFFTTIENYL